MKSELPLRANRLLPALCAAAIALGCYGPGGTRPDILLVTLDTLRADRLDLARRTSPSIERLAAGGVVFAEARSASGWTMPSMASLLTGRRPEVHGAVSPDAAISSDLPTLAEILRESGYETRAYVSHEMLGTRYGFHHGFDRFDETLAASGDARLDARAQTLTDRVLDDVDRRPPGRPWFLWVHYSDEGVGGGAAASSPSEAEGRYDDRIAFTSRQVGRLLDGLARRGLLDGAVRVLTAAHGEEFAPAGALHDSLHAGVLQIPIVIGAPRLEPGKRSLLARDIDVAPTVLSLVEIQAPVEWSGCDLFTVAPDEDLPAFYARDVPAGFVQRAVRIGDRKLIVVEIAGEAGDRAPEAPHLAPGVYLYDKVRDPGETTNLYVREDPLARALLALLREHFRDPQLGRRTDTAAARAGARGGT
jgi:arylsulfatase A-like enzyme